jgi:hypothetical protein
MIENSQGQKTCLSGSTDYFSFGLSGQDDIHAFKSVQSTWTGSNQELYKNVAQALSKVMQTFVIVEAKSPLARLEPHIPQVVAEATAL